MYLTEMGKVTLKRKADGRVWKDVLKEVALELNLED